MKDNMTTHAKNIADLNQEITNLHQKIQDASKTVAQIVNSAMAAVDLSKNTEDKIYSLKELSAFEVARSERERKSAMYESALSKIKFSSFGTATHANAGQLQSVFLRGVPHTVILSFLGFLAGLVIGLLLMGAF